MPVIPVDRAWFELASDWVCEVLSPSTAALDRWGKLEIWAREGVAHVWFVDPEAETLEVLALDPKKGRYVVDAVHTGKSRARPKPFDARELELATLWGR